MNALKNLRHFHIPAKRRWTHLTPGTRLKLRDDVYQQIKERIWIFNKMDCDGVHLIHESMAYGLIVRMEDIDWSEFRENVLGRQRSSLPVRKGAPN